MSTLRSKRRKPEDSIETLLDLIYQEVVLRRQAGEDVSRQELEARFPELASQIATLLEVDAALASGASASDDDDARRTGDVADAAAPAPRIPGYEILAPLGRGGMGVVYRARQTSLGRLVALKFVAADATHDADALARFQREAKTVSALPTDFWRWRGTTRTETR